MKSIAAIALMSIIVTPMVSAAEEGKVYGKLEGRVLATGGGRVIVFDKDGKTLWQHKASNCHDVSMLPNGNILFADREAVEVDPKTNTVVFRYKSTVKPHEGVFSCQRLANGNTMIGENSTGKILEVDKDAKVVFELQLPDIKVGAHHNFRMVRKLENGNYLVCYSGKNRVREYTPKGEMVLELKTGHLAFSAVRLPNGNTMVGHINNVTEFDPKGKKVWEFSKQKDAKGMKISMMCGLHVLENGNIVIGVYNANRGDKGAAIFEINRAKEIIWRYCGKDRSMMNMQKLTVDGKMLEKKPIH